MATQAIGTEVDLSARGMGKRTMRYAMIVDDGTVGGWVVGIVCVLGRCGDARLLGVMCAWVGGWGWWLYFIHVTSVSTLWVAT